MAGEFTERRQRILKLVVHEFIESANAVASETLVRKYNLSFSSATVRNELAALEELGYLTQLHTSAGRIPTDTGYRFFVEHLMERVPLSSVEQREIRAEFAHVQGELSQWIRLGASVLARRTRNASVVTTPQAYQARFKHLELLAIYDATILLVLVLQDGTVRQQTFTAEQVIAQDDLRRVSQRVNERCENLSVERINELKAGDEPYSEGFLRELEQRVMRCVLDAMHQFEQHVNRDIYSDGLIEMLSQPEFIPSLLKEEDTKRAIERMQHVLETLTRGDVLGTLIVKAMESDDVFVVIGDEHNNDEMREYSVVLSRYGVNGEVTGVLGIIGPTRMAYPRSISTVEYLSSVMSEMLSHLYGKEIRLSSSQPSKID
ncbi:MAG: heat-inducible transcription repressor HrcA [Chloroflexaceae bacterium]|nr:heat-inducible transcription repressor HrcA [Chloroflexaceae bacterium]NJL34616.1 heat-inducible transcription repressor HrcA [Chloroflexaceae bacterium]NJO05013.1 heat-inducible transcription repressor HrcA [Chloroflexaceae bacterium]